MEAAAHFSPETLTYCHGTHVAEVEVDAGTGRVDVLNYVIVHDSGRLINPMIVDGQVTGGAAHGIGCALFERMIYDDRGQPLTTNFGEYLLPSAPETPRFEIVHQESPTPLNPLGVKGAGEGGLIPVAAAVSSAVEGRAGALGRRRLRTADQARTARRDDARRARRRRRLTPAGAADVQAALNWPWKPSGSG